MRQCLEKFNIKQHGMKIQLPAGEPSSKWNWAAVKQSKQQPRPSRHSSFTGSLPF